MLDANTFTDNEVSNQLNQNFINFKINAESDYGKKLFFEYNGNAYPLILFLDQNKKEIDRFYGFYEPKEFLEKLNVILEGSNTFPNLVQQYELGDHSSETIALLAKKYADRGETTNALELYKLLLKSKNVSHLQFHEAQYYVAVQLLWGNGPDSLEIYINKNPDSPFLKDAVYQLLAYYSNNNQVEDEIMCYNKYLLFFSNDAHFLNGYAWRMTELNENLQNALDKVNIALELLDDTDQQYANILDTKAEILWKLEQYDEAVLIINEAIKINPQNIYYNEQKTKFLNSN